jgi:hypothetical protein
MVIVYVYIPILTHGHMKNFMTLLAFGTLFLFSHESIAQDYLSAGQEGQPKIPKIWVGADAQIAIPLASLKEFSKTRGGIRLEVGKPFKASPSLSVGLEFSGVFSGSRDDKFKGMDVNTSTTLVSLQPFIRWAPTNKAAVNPFFDFSMGIMASSTATTSEIVDEATFLEEVLLGKEDEVETITHQTGGSANFSLSAGAGVTIKKFIRVGVRYHHTYPVDYIDTEKISIKDTSIHYEVNRIPIDMIVVTVGLFIGKIH